MYIPAIYVVNKVDQVCLLTLHAWLKKVADASVGLQCIFLTFWLHAQHIMRNLPQITLEVMDRLPSVHPNYSIIIHLQLLQCDLCVVSV